MFLFVCFWFFGTEMYELSVWDFFSRTFHKCVCVCVCDDSQVQRARAEERQRTTKDGEGINIKRAAGIIRDQ